MKTCYSGQSFKVSHYQPNGDGRDQYISTTNGGFYTNTFPFRFGEQGRTSKISHSKSVPKLDAKCLKYTSNGSGRDTYVGSNYGGFISSAPKYSFYTSLRTATPPACTFKLYNRPLAHSQKRLNTRLSLPKHHPCPQKK